MSAHLTASRAGSVTVTRTWHRLAGTGRWARRLRRGLRGIAGRLFAFTHQLATRRSGAMADPARMACAPEGASLEFGTVEIDGRRWGALYRSGELVCLLEAVDRL